MDSITLKSYAKVNIGLRVLDQREDGYHNIHTIFQELAFHDTVTTVSYTHLTLPTSDLV